MEVLNFLMMFIFFLGFLINLEKKLITLLMIEGLMLSLIFYYSGFMNIYNLSYFFLLMMTLMMVLDSVMGLSILIFISRNSSFKNAPLNFF